MELQGGKEANNALWNSCCRNREVVMLGDLVLRQAKLTEDTLDPEVLEIVIDQAIAIGDALCGPVRQAA